MQIVGKAIGVGETWRCREDEPRTFGECECEKGVGGAGKRRNGHRPAFLQGGGRKARCEKLERVFHLAAVDYTILVAIWGGGYHTDQGFQMMRPSRLRRAGRIIWNPWFIKSFALVDRAFGKI